jgi:hypothetical protein
MNLDATRNTLITGNTFDVVHGGVTEDHGRGLRIEGNTLKSGSFQLESISATVARNTVGTKGRIAVGDVAGGGLVRVLDNTIEVGALRTGLTVTAAHRIEVRGNTIRGRHPRSNGIFVFCREQSPGLAIVARNHIEGLRIGMNVACAKEGGKFAVELNDVRQNSDTGIVLRGFGATLRANTIENNGTGIAVYGKAEIGGGVVRGNRRAGILVHPKAEAEIRGVHTGDNGGPGIDLAPGGVTPNAAHKTANGNIPFPEAKYDAKTGRLRGTACDGCRIEIYESEVGSKRGNPRNGEGRGVIGSVTAGPDGRWEFPARHPLDCPASGTVTMTATRGGTTSEFSVDVDCACVIAKMFAVSGAGTPRSGYWSFGLSVRFPKGSKVERGVLADVLTGERPRADAMEFLRWEEVQRDVTPSPAGILTREFLVNVSYTDSTAIALSRKLWRFSIAYSPPRNATGCSATATKIFGRRG